MCGQEGLARVTGECVVPASKTLCDVRQAYNDFFMRPTVEHYSVLSTHALLCCTVSRDIDMILLHESKHIAHYVLLSD